MALFIKAVVQVILEHAKYYAHVTGYLLRHGTPAAQIGKVLDYTQSPYRRKIPPLPPAFKTKRRIPIIPAITKS
jgi:hypothetical protein